MAELPAGLSIAAPSGRNAELAKLFKGHTETVTVQPKGWVLPGNYREYATELREYDLKDDDVVLMTFPKSGTTWGQEILWTLLNNAALDNPEATSLALPRRSPVLEGDIILPDMFGSDDPADTNQFPHGLNLQKIGETKGPRCIKTHLSFDLISPTVLSKAKVVYMLRDPRDVCISYYYHCRLFKYETYTGTFEEFVESFMNDATYYSPYWTHVHEAWSRRNHPRVHILSYDLLKKNTKQEYRKLNDFLQTKIPEGQLDRIIEYCSFAEMKKREHHASLKEWDPLLMDMEIAEKDGGGFFKKGESGRHKEVLTKEHQRMFEEWAVRHCPDLALKTLLMP